MISHRESRKKKILEWNHMRENATSIENLGHESDVTVEFIYSAYMACLALVDKNFFYSLFFFWEKHVRDKKLLLLISFLFFPIKLRLCIIKCVTHI